MPVQDIYKSLQQLSDAVAGLETIIVAREHSDKQKPAVAQIDMFGGWSPAPVKTQNNNALLAKKLDSTIDRVQQLLGQAGGY